MMPKANPDAISLSKTAQQNLSDLAHFIRRRLAGGLEGGDEAVGLA
jgi:hypothetical protein